MCPDGADETVKVPDASDRASPDAPRTATEPDASPVERVADPSDAFAALGNEVRMGILETMLERTDAGSPRSTFSDLYEASGVDTSAGFAYHLDRLVGPYLRKYDEEGESGRGAGYELTYAGSQIARAIATGAYTHRVDHPPVALEEACPFCDREALWARSTDNVVTVACEACERPLLRLGYPPSGLAAHGEEFPTAFDRHHRHRLTLMREGICPACAGQVDARLEPPATRVAESLPDALTAHVQVAFACETCGVEARCPVSLALLEHPAVVSFYHEHGRDARDLPIWNVGHEWAEAILSEDPLAVRVVVDLEGDLLALYVDETLTVVDVQRSSA